MWSSLKYSFKNPLNLELLFIRTFNSYPHYRIM